MKISIKITALLLCGGALFVSGDARACTVCHSKNPKMVAMHEALEFKDCFDCHGPTAKTLDEPRKQMLQDERCIRCHAEKPQSGQKPKGK